MPYFRSHVPVTCFLPDSTFPCHPDTHQLCEAMTVCTPASQMQETFDQCCPAYRKGTDTSCMIWISFHVLVVRGLISHDEGQAGRANQDLAICKSVRSRCIQFSDCLEDYAEASLMHLRSPVANLTFRCPCIFCCLSRILRQTSRLRFPSREC